MTEKKRITTPLTQETLSSLQAGDQVLITGVLYTARDAAHKRLVEALEKGETLPFELEGQVIYYVGPSPARPGEVIGAAGPTTSYRMDSYAPRLMVEGLKGMIGKGDRSKAVVDAMVQHQVVYFAAIGGAGALIGDAVRAAEVIAYAELGAEAVRRLVVVDFPAIVAIDAKGHNLYETEIQKFRR